MTPTLTPPDRTDDDREAAPRRPARAPHAGELFDALLVPAPADDRHDGPSWAPPAGWRDSGFVAFVRRQPPERRETLLALVFGTVSVLVGLFGMAAWLAGTTGRFVGIVVVLAAVALAPRPEPATLHRWEAAARRHAEAVRRRVDDVRRRVERARRG